MNLTTSPRFLPAVLWADAASCLASGALQLALAPQLAELLGLPQALLVATGWVLIAVAAFAAWLARGRPASRTGVYLLVAGNIGWVLGCLELAIGSGATALGIAWLLFQAIAVLALAVLEWAGVRRAPRAAWA
jgi:hypothetical protein